MTQQQINYAKMKTQLEKELQQLHEEAGGKRDNSAVNPDRADLAQSYAQTERRKILHELNSQRAEQIAAALDRLEEGSYGFCAQCGAPIAPGRLEIMAYAKYCVHCQADREEVI